MEAYSLYNIAAFAGIDWSEFVIRTLLNISAIFIIIHIIKSGHCLKNDFLFVLIVINIQVFLISYFVTIPQISAGYAFGAFVVFITQRYNHTYANPNEIIYISLGIFMAYLNGANSTNISIFNASIVDIFIISLVLVYENVINNSSNQRLVR